MKRLLPRIVLGLVFLACAVTAAELLFIPDEHPGPPAYMRLESAGPNGITDFEWVAIPIYREIDGIPLDFNLLDFLDTATPERAAYARSVPMLVQGFVIRESSASGPAFLQHYEDRPDAPTPVLFVSWDELRDEVADGELYIDELLAMDSLQVGMADFYLEHIRTAWTHSLTTSGVIAYGSLAGAHFRVTYDHGAATHVPGVETHITIE